LTKFKSVILSKVYNLKKNFKNLKKAADLFRKNLVSNKVNKPGRRDNCLNGQNRQWKCLWQTPILEHVFHVIWYC